MTGAVLFDLDRTLLDHDHAAEMALRALLSEGVDESEFGPAWEEWERLENIHYPAYLAGELDLDGHRSARAGGMLDWLAARGAAHGDVTPAQWFASYLERYRENWRPFEDVAACLAELGPRAAGVITNADGDAQRAKLRALGLTETLPVLVASGDAGCAKPDPRIFAAGAEAVGLPPERIAYVGDQLETDARGAAAAGLRGIWLNRGAPADAPADVEVISSLSELPRLLGAAA